MGILLDLAPLAVGIGGYWALWRARSRMKPHAMTVILTTAFVYVLVKGVLFPDEGSRYALVDGSLVLLGFLLVTGCRVDVLAGPQTLRSGESVHPRRSTYVWAGLFVGLVLCAVFDFVVRPSLR